MKPQRYVSGDERFETRLEGNIVGQLLQHCRRAHPNETGGVLAGRYSDSYRVAIVSRISGPASGSKHGRWSFYRAVGQLQQWLDRLWERGRGFYLGEWHFHPGGSAEPSSTDREQMWRIARDRAYACPEPVLLILGGDPDGDWSMSVTVFTRDGGSTRLTPGGRLGRRGPT